MFHIPIATAFGARLAGHLSHPPLPSAPAAALAFACDLDRQADLLLSEGKHGAADRLAHLAYELRARAVATAGAGQ